LINEILTVHSGNVSRAIGRMSRDSWGAGLKRIKGGSKRVILPDVSDVLPKRSVFLLKAADRGKKLTDEIRDKITKDLREVLHPGVIRRRGTLAGTVNPKAIKQFEEKLKTSFQGYTKKDPSYGVPSNAHNIAVTEVRINADAMKNEYTKKLIEKNEGKLRVMKSVRKNNYLVKEPRPEHEKLAASTQRKPIPFDQNYIYKTMEGVVISTPHMHHSSMPANQVIGCQCEDEYKAVLIK
jgi:hypothetical protein